DQVDRLMKICESLQECLDVERKALIHLNVDELLQNNVMKETMMARFSEEKYKLQSILSGSFGVAQLSEVETVLSGEDAAVWAAKHAVWKAVWGKTHKFCARNREFLA